MASSLSSRKRRLDGLEKEFEGAEYEQDDSDEVVTISTRNTPDYNRWRGTTPSFSQYPLLTRLDLHKNRYITALDPSVATMTHLKVLNLSQCSQLQKLPEGIGALVNLETVNFVLCLCSTLDISIH